MIEEDTAKPAGEIPPTLNTSIGTNELTKKEQFVLEEYKTAVRLTFDVDGQRNTITKFYLLFAGVAVSGVVFLVDKGSIAHFDKIKLTADLLLGISIVGIYTVAVLAKLRSVQIEHFKIICSIRDYFLKDDKELQKVVILSSKDLPTPNNKSGTYYWLSIVMFVNAAIFSCFMHIYLFVYLELIPHDYHIILYILFYLLILWIAYKLQSKFYFKLVKAKDKG